MANKDQIVSRSAGAAPGDAMEPASARGPHQTRIEDKDPGPIDDHGTAKVVPIGEGRFGVIWNGRLRLEKYPSRRFAYLALAALLRSTHAPKGQ